jgi:hypothetical protein
MSAEMLAAIAGAVLSLLFSYVPGLNSWYQALEATYKRLIMLVLLIVVASASIGLACAGWGADFGLTLTCDRAGAAGLIQALILAVMANQATFTISPQTNKTK